MRKQVNFVSLAFFLFLILISLAIHRPASAIGTKPSPSTLTPRHVLQAPVSQGIAPPTDPYWFQVGVKGDNSTNHFTGANITIRTTYDDITLADHSYWVGSFLSNFAFIQVGYLTTISEDGKPYCCAWFYEFFPPYGSSPPVIGPPGSAGPIGSWHTYSMLSQGNGWWNFYMDNQLVGLPQYVQANDSGPFVASPTAEIAGADNNREILGPAEFKNFQVRLPKGWEEVPSARSVIYFAAGFRPNIYTPTNPYGVWEVEGVNNDFLVGSYIPQAGPVHPLPQTLLWPVPALPYHKVNFTFLDRDQQPFAPAWIALKDNASWSLHTSYQNELIPDAPSGKWTLNWTAWHMVNVAPKGLQLSIPGITSLTVHGSVFPATVQVLGSFYASPVSDATIQITFPDSLTAEQQTDSSGHTVFQQLPTGNYTFKVQTPFRMPSYLSLPVLGPGTTTIRVLGLGDLIIILLPPTAGITIITRIVRKNDSLRNLIVE